MDKVLSIDGGQPLRTDDWELIQNQYSDGFKSLINGLAKGQKCILMGLVKTINSGTISITEGFIFDGSEIFHVAAASFTENVLYTLYLAEHFTTTESRTFKDNSTHDVWQYRRHEFGYGQTPPQGSIVYSTLKSIDQLLMVNNLDSLTHFTAVASMQYQAGFTGVGESYTAVECAANGINQVMIIGAFTADVPGGKLCTLPTEQRPTGDVIGYFYNGKSAGILCIKPNGELHITGASISSENYIQFIFSKSFTNLVGYDVNVSGWGGTP